MEIKGFAKAGIQVNRSQPAVCMQIKRIEIILLSNNFAESCPFTIQLPALQ